MNTPSVKITISSAEETARGLHQARTYSVYNACSHDLKDVHELTESRFITA